MPSPGFPARALRSLFAGLAALSALGLAAPAAAAPVFDSGSDYPDGDSSLFMSHLPWDQIVGLEVSFGSDQILGGTTFTGAYYGDTPATDVITMLVYGFDGGEPAASPLATRSLTDIERSDAVPTGGSYDVYDFSAAFDPLSLAAGDYIFLLATVEGDSTLAFYQDAAEVDGWRWNNILDWTEDEGLAFPMTLSAAASAAVPAPAPLALLGAGLAGLGLLRRRG